MADTGRRMLLLLSLLQNGRPWPAADLADRLEVSPRTLRRDVERLRGLGYPVRSRSGPGGAYRLPAGRAIPPLVLDADEAVAVAVGLHLAEQSAGGGDGAAARRAEAKLARALPGRLRQRVAEVRSATESAVPVSGVDPAVVGLVAAAAADARRIAFRYLARRSAARDRVCEPSRLVLEHTRWYLVGWDVDRADWRVYRLDRMTSVAVLDEPFTPRPLPAGTALAQVRLSRGTPRHRVVLLFDASPDTVAGRLGLPGADVRPVGDGTTRCVVDADSAEWVLLHAGLVGADFTVAEPEWVAAACAELGRRLVTAAAPPGGGGVAAGT